MSSSLCNKRRQVCLVVFGEGGHSVQAERLIARLGGCSPLPFVTISNVETLFPNVEENIRANDLRDKNTGKASLSSIFGLMKALNRARKYRVSCVISTGPGIAIFPSIFFKVFYRAKIIHIETWSRFYSKSMAGRFMYYICDVFYVQNKELVKLYPKSLYSGRL